MPLLEIHIQNESEIPKVLKAIRKVLGYMPCYNVKKSYAHEQ